MSMQHFFCLNPKTCDETRDFMDVILLEGVAGFYSGRESNPNISKYKSLLCHDRIMILNINSSKMRENTVCLPVI